MTSRSSAPSRVARDDGYGRSSRFYDIPTLDVKLPSVTTILQAVNKPALVPWAAKMERELVMEAAANLWEDVPTAPKMSRAAFVATLMERVGKEKAHSKLLKQAGDIGTQVHALIEWNMRRELGQLVGPEPRILPQAQWAFMAYEDWKRSVNLTPLLIEQTVWSVKHGFAGTADWVGEITHDGKRVRVLGDWKSGKAIYGESVLQNSAYAAALTEMGHGGNLEGGVIVRLPKVETDPAFEARYIDADEQASSFAAFLHVMEVWKWMETDKQGGHA